MPLSNPETWNGVRRRFREALCLPPGTSCLPSPSVDQHDVSPERGSAVVEFTFLALLLMVPLVYFIITMGQIQGGSFAVVGAADQAAKVYVAQSDAQTGQAAAEEAAMLALADYGHEPESARVIATCDPDDCMAAGSTVTVTVELTVALPFVPFSEAVQLNATHLSAAATQIVGRFR